MRDDARRTEQIVLSKNAIDSDAGVRRAQAQRGLPAAEAGDGGVLADRSASVVRLFLDRLAATPRAEAFRFPEVDFAA